MTIAAAARPRPIGLAAFLASTTMLFTAFTAALLVRRAASDWSPSPLPLAAHLGFIPLVAASLVLEAARRRSAAARGAWFRGAALLGLVFLAAQAAAAVQMAPGGVFLRGNPHREFFVLLAGVHAAHFLGGMIALALAGRGRIGPGACAAYWHFLGFVWLWIVILLTVL